MSNKILEAYVQKQKLKSLDDVCGEANKIELASNDKKAKVDNTSDKLVQITFKAP